ncbi:MAG: CDP-archaeol synthase [Ktedonobacteraceae bacterium]|nr:CDP-archaeol synthase [Ktedonobacteraceae bacterium]
MPTLLNDLLFVLWFFLPAGLANMMPILVARLPLLKKLDFPLDCYATFRHKRVFGSHKTIRGFLSGILAGILTTYLQVFLYSRVPFIQSFVSIDYTTLNAWLFGLLASGGALTGDALRSFFKRQMDIAPGKTWFPFDQLDYIIGGVLFTVFYIQLTLWQYLLLFAIWFLLHPLSTFIGYQLKLKESPI